MKSIAATVVILGLGIGTLVWTDAARGILNFVRAERVLDRANSESTFESAPPAVAQVVIRNNPRVCTQVVRAALVDGGLLVHVKAAGSCDRYWEIHAQTRTNTGIIVGDFWTNQTPHLRPGDVVELFYDDTSWVKKNFHLDPRAATVEVYTEDMS